MLHDIKFYPTNTGLRASIVREDNSHEEFRLDISYQGVHEAHILNFMEQVCARAKEPKAHVHPAYHVKSEKSLVAQAEERFHNQTNEGCGLVESTHTKYGQIDSAKVMNQQFIHRQVADRPASVWDPEALLRSGRIDDPTQAKLLADEVRAQEDALLFGFQYEVAKDVTVLRPGLENRSFDVVFEDTRWGTLMVGQRLLHNNNPMVQIVVTHSWGHGGYTVKLLSADLREYIAPELLKKGQIWRKAGNQ